MTTNTLHENIVIIDRTKSIPAAELASVAAAIQTQVARDLSKWWPVSATIATLPADAPVPVGWWPVFIVPVLGDGEGGYHTDENGQPYAYIGMGPEWIIATSHEILEMLVDPYGNRVKPSRDVQIINKQLVTHGSLTLSYLVEVCDPCEDNAYQINGITVSDFYTPHYFDPLAVAGVRYSFTGALKAPRSLQPGGYLSWLNPKTKTWQQALWLDPHQPPQIVDLGPLTGSKSLRETLRQEARSLGHRD